MNREVAGWHHDAVLLADVVAVSAAVAATRSRTAKAAAIADLLRRAGADEVEPVTAWLAGRAAPGPARRRLADPVEAGARPGGRRRR